MGIKKWRAKREQARIEKLRQQRRETEERANRMKKMAKESRRIDAARTTINESRPKSKFWGAVGKVGVGAAKMGVQAGSNMAHNIAKEQKRFKKKGGMWDF